MSKRVDTNSMNIRGFRIDIDYLDSGPRVVGTPLYESTKSGLTSDAWISFHSERYSSVFLSNGTVRTLARVLGEVNS